LGSRPKNFYKHPAFGLTQPKGIDVSGRTSSHAIADKMQDSHATTAFGQGVDVNMVQIWRSMWSPTAALRAASRSSASATTSTP
jgi:hypothetical protein